jgi:hypothetical protein
MDENLCITLFSMDENLCITLFSMDGNTYSHPEEACDGKKKSERLCLGECQIFGEDESKASEKPLDGRLCRLGWQITPFS